MPLKVKSGAALATPVAQPTAKATKTGAAKKAKLDLDAVGAKVADTTKLNGPGAVQKGATVPGILEAFPIDALSQVDGKGLSGTTFMLDAGSLRGLKLQARRVVDGGQPGLEITFQLTEGKLKGLLDRMKEKDAEPAPVTFRGAKLEDGVAHYTSETSTLSESSTHAPPDMDDNASAWALKLEDAKGAKVTVAHEGAALAIRGLVRLELRGTDAECTEQLKGVVKALGLQHVFAPPTPKSKEVAMLMRALWQADHAAATSFAKEDLDKLKPTELRAALESAGFTKDRIAGLRYEEVFPGHFTTVDPKQVDEMVAAGARYLYSTVTSPEHVHSILQNGQKSSVQRYKDGLIIEGMSTAADFVTGGGCGVFTRLVTQDAIYNGESWTGRTYKMLQNASQLGRTDWFGWDGDYFGRRWDLATDTNFGTKLVEKIDAEGSYQTSNELIFTAGNRPQNIDRVIATSDEDRTALIEHLKSQGYKPHNGLSVEDFVVMSPSFLPFGPSPYADVKDLPAFAEQALTEAKKKTGLKKLQWLLFEGPSGPAKAHAEQKVLVSGTDAAQDVLFKAAAHRGTFAMSAAELEATMSKLAKDDPDLLARLTSEAGEAMFRSGSAAALAALQKVKPENSYYQPFGMSDDAFVRVYRDLASKQVPGEPLAPALALALEARAQHLLEYGHKGFRDFLQAHPLVAPKNPVKWLDETLASVKKNGAGKAELGMYIAQLTDAPTIAKVQRKLLEDDGAATLALLKTSLAMHGGLKLPGAEIAKLMAEMTPQSKTRAHLLDSCAGALLKTAEPKLLEMLQKKYKGPYDSNMGIYDGAEWMRILEAQRAVTKGKLTDVIRTTMEVGGNYLVPQKEFREFLKTADGLYSVGKKPEAFAVEATKEMNGKGGAVKLAWMLHGPDAAALKRHAIVAILKSDDYQARAVLTNGSEEAGKFPATKAELRELVAECDAKSLEGLLSIAGRDVLLAADGPTLAKLEAHFKGKDHVMNSFGLWGTTVTSLLHELGEKTGDAKKARDFVLRHAAGSMIAEGDAGFLALLKTQKLGYADLGKDAAWAAQQVKAACDNISYYWTSSYYKEEAEYKKLPAGAEFLMTSPSGGYDADVLGEIQKSIKGWGWQKAMVDRFLAVAKDLPADWKKKIAAAAKAGE